MGRSKSLTSIDSLAPGMAAVGSGGHCCPGGQHDHDADCRSESDSGGRLTVPHRSDSAGADHSPTSPGYHRRRKLSTASKVSSSEFFTVYFECLDGDGDKGQEEFVPATRGTCLREAIAAVCERRGVDVDSINVYLEQSRTPLPLLTSETAWLGGRHIRIRAKDDSKSPVRGPGRVSVTAPPSRKTSAVNNSYRSKSRLFSPSVSNSEDSATCAAAAVAAQASQSLGVATNHHSTPSLASLHVNSISGANSSAGLVSLGGSLPVTSVAPAGSGDGSLKVTKSNKPANRWSGLWGSSSKDTKMDLLVQHLDTYSRLGIPKLHHLVAFEAEDEVEEALYSLEEDWTEIVRNSHMLSERTRSQQTALWELVETEVAYIRTLKVIQDLFLNCLCNLQNNLTLTEIDTERLFCNIPEIYAANRVFWHDYIVPMLKASRETGEPLNPILLQEGFLRFEEIFNPYSRYCSEQTNCQEYCKEQDRNNEIFKAYLAWCETQKDCNRLRLIDILVRPMQRLTKYSLLLKAILKKTEDEEQQRTLTLMAKKVESFVSHVNSHLRQRQENERLKTIIARIDSYEPVETKDEDLERLVQSHCRLDLTAPMPGCTDSQRRNLLFEGDLKLKEGSTKMDVHAFLFSDMLLLCKILTKKSHSSNPEAKMRIIRQPFVIDRLVVADYNKDSGSSQFSGASSSSATGLAAVYLNEYAVVSAAFTLHSSEPKIIKVWKEQIAKAKEIYEEAKAASASQIDRFFFTSYGSNPIGGVGNDADLDEDFPSTALLSATGSTAGRRGSFRGSHLSSVAHSHSGSMDLMEVGGSNFRRDVSLELSQALSSDQNRASSLSSEEGGGGQPQQQTGSSSVEAKDLPYRDGMALKTPSVSHQASYPSSPRAERRSNVVKSPTPNTLTVQIPYGPVQSLPNLTATSPTSLQSSCEGGGSDGAVQAPRRAGSPAPPRGISYPPLSPKSSLRRGMAVSQQSGVKNPPLIKSRHVVSCNQDASGQQSQTIPVITGVLPPPDEEEHDVCSELDPSPFDQTEQASAAAATNRRTGGRVERTDARRYHTAGAIEDIKKQDGRDNSIQKRLSWNYGQHIPSNELQLQRGPAVVTRHASKCLSSDSMQSSSGVSSTGSLHLSIGSEWDDTSSSSGTIVTATHISGNIAASKEEQRVPDASDPGSTGSTSGGPTSLMVVTTTTPTSSSTSPLPSPGFSSAQQSSGRSPSKLSSQQQQQQPPPVPPRANLNQHVSTTYITQDEVTVVQPQQVAVVQNNTSPTKTNKNEILKLREILLSDNSVESSNV